MNDTQAPDPTRTQTPAQAPDAPLVAAPTPDPSLSAALAAAVERAEAALEAVEAITPLMRAARGDCWRAGDEEVERAEEAARRALHHARAAEALLRHSIATEPIKTIVVYERQDAHGRPSPAI